MLYSPTTGKRVKEPFNHINWVHKALKQPEFELRQCLFGEHLLIDKTKPVAIVESEKTAVIASVYFPQFIWVAVGSLTNLNDEKCSILKGRTVTLLPDLNGFDKWSSKVKELSHLAKFSVSDLLERKATEADRKKGLDIADFLLQFPVKEFQLKEIKLHTENIASFMGATYTGKDFNNIIIQGVKTNEGNCYDLFINEAGELIKRGEQEETINHLAQYFEKCLKPASFNNTLCWVHAYNLNPTVNNNQKTTI